MCAYQRPFLSWLTVYVRFIHPRSSSAASASSRERNTCSAGLLMMSPSGRRIPRSTPQLSMRMDSTVPLVILFSRVPTQYTVSPTLQGCSTTFPARRFQRSAASGAKCHQPPICAWHLSSAQRTLTRSPALQYLAFPPQNGQCLRYQLSHLVSLLYREPDNSGQGFRGVVVLGQGLFKVCLYLKEILTCPLSALMRPL